MFCKQCGTKIEDDELFCPNCGYAVRPQAVSNVQGYANQTVAPAPVTTATSYAQQNISPYAPVDGTPAVENKSKVPLILMLSAFVIVFAAIATVIFVKSNSSSSPLQEQLDLGNRYLSELNYRQAVACFEAAIEIDPKEVDAYTGLAEAYIGLEDVDAVISVCERAADNLSKSELKSVEKTATSGISDLIETAMDDGDYEKAKEYAVSLSSIDEKSSEKFINEISNNPLAQGSSEAGDPASSGQETPVDPEEEARLEQERLDAEAAEAYEEFIANTCGDTAIEAYGDYFEKTYGFKNIQQMGKCYCIYLNDDKIPELIVDAGDAAGGAMIFTYGPEGVSECYLARGEFEYWEKENIIDNCFGHMGAYGDAIVKIKNGSFDTIVNGYYEIKEQYLTSSDWDGDDKWNCEWDGESVSMSEYNKKKDSYLPRSGGEWNSAYDIGIAIYDSYSFMQAYYDLQIRWGEADYWDYYGGMEKPNIYIYPDLSAQASVTLNGHSVVETNALLTINGGELTAAWPGPVANGNEYNWHVYASADGTLYDEKGNEYSYLFWEGNSDWTPDFSKGFCVKGEDTAEFLRKTLKEMGLTPKEYNEFIVYWAPRMEGNAYNLISFQSDVYDSACPLNVTDGSGKTPDNMLRVMMAWKPLDKKVSIAPQTFKPFTRDGFTVVEWGGRECK